MIINLSGIIIRMGVSDLRVMGRATQGVRLINLKEDDGIAAVAKVECEIDEIEDEEIIEGFAPTNDDNSEIASDDSEPTEAEIE
jgi:DNA gyrase subunit A